MQLKIAAIVAFRGAEAKARKAYRPSAKDLRPIAPIRRDHKACQNRYHFRAAGMILARSCLGRRADN
jgi:hypothetical protein